MKKLILIVLLVVMASLAFGHPQGPQRDLRDELIQPTDGVYRTYGYDDETLPLYNIWANQAAVKNYEIRIKKLEDQIAELVKQLAALSEKATLDEAMTTVPPKRYFDAEIDGVTMRCVENDDGTVSVVDDDTDLDPDEEAE